MTSGDGELDNLRDSMRRVLDDLASRERVQSFYKSGQLYEKALWDEASNLGWLALTVPEDLGGLGLGFDAAAVLYEELGRCVAPIPVLGTFLAAQAIARCGTEAQRASWLPELASGLAPASLAVIDPGAEARLPRLRIEPDGGLVLSGEAHDLLDGAAAEQLLVTARSEDGAMHLVLVRPRTDGVAVQAEPLVDRTRHLARARFDALMLPADRRLGEKALDPDLSEALLEHAALALACDAMGGAEVVLAFTLEYLRTRQQFGKPIGSFQALKHRCANHKVALEAARMLVHDAVRRSADGCDDASLQASLAKAYACDVAAAIATDAVQLHGGIGVTWEHPCHLFLKRARLNEALFGARATHEDRAANLLLKAGAAA